MAWTTYAAAVGIAEDGRRLRLVEPEVTVNPDGTQSYAFRDAS